ncbi:MAG: Do family serine endopeptidase [Chitinispirillales bacterium]|jgi:serine protease Do|nr:Do family serine endopeptidase [Chitinispirillales bacterium]
MSKIAKIKFPLIQMIAIFAVIIPVILFGASSRPVSEPAAEDGRPARGAVSFGAQSAPNVDVPRAVQGFATVFADVAEAVVPTVVSVIPTKIDTVVFTNNPFHQFFPEGWNPFEDFFGGGRNRRGPGQGQQPQQPQPRREERRQQGLGSGVIVSSDGYILTNSHVISGAAEIEVKLSDGRSFAADIVGEDSLSDVAVIKIRDRVSNLPVAYLGDSDKLRPGDWAVAIGNPFSLTSSVTMGIVSALGRATPMPGRRGGASFQDFIQTDAAINPGNSGGALVNIKGELIGINTMIYTQSGGNMGIGFAIPINMARRIMEDLIHDGRVSRGWIGVSIQELDQTTRDAFGLAPETRGVLVGDVFKDQPAYKAGIQRGDVITNIGGRTTETLNQLRNSVAAVRPGQTVPVEFLRNGRRHTVRVTVTSRDESEVASAHGASTAEDEPQSAAAGQILGMTVGSITGELRGRLNLQNNVQGVIVTEVQQGSQAAQEGFRINDIILEVNRRPVPAIGDYSRVVKDLKAGDSVLFLIMRDGRTFYLAIRIR